MASHRARYVLLMIGTLLLFGLSGMFFGRPAVELLASGETAAGGWLLALCLVIDVTVITGAMLLARLDAFRYEPVDWILSPAERRKAQTKKSD
ncbi:hypothetical protein [Glaciibacter flavus]|uniref:hypothetical protein n=1 Tax=Orlajensenia flava TaxID=2565934 RepID=UPI003B00A888